MMPAAAAMQAHITRQVAFQAAADAAERRGSLDQQVRRGLETSKRGSAVH
jgi:hypothetical protein